MAIFLSRAVSMLQKSAFSKAIRMAKIEEFQKSG